MDAIARLKQSQSFDTPELDAQLIACKVLSTSRTRLYAFPETRLTPKNLGQLQAYLDRRLAGEPVAYLCGLREFWSMDLQVSQGTLIPRADTEILVEQALASCKLAPDGPILDLGTGSGAIAIALARELPYRDIVAIDRSKSAVSVASTNVGTFAQANVSLVIGHWLEAFADNSMAMIVSNPPYLSSTDPHLVSLSYEPASALVSGKTGLEDLEYIVRESTRVAKASAPLILEHGNEQGKSVRQLLLDYSYVQVDTVQDLAGNERVSFGTKPSTHEH